MKQYIPGLILCTVLAVIAHFLSISIPLGGVTLAILLGMIVRNVMTLPPVFGKGTGFAEKILLEWAILLMGASLDFHQIKTLGLPLVFIIIGGISFTIILSLLIGRIGKIDKDLALLIGVGNAVCGSSAIAAVQGVVEAEEDKVGLSIGVINFLGTLGIFLLPSLVLALPFLSETRGGILIGNCLQAIGQVSAAGFSMGDETGRIATVVKMGRILMILPVVLTVSFFRGGTQGASAGRKPMVPWYIAGFVLLSLAGTFHLIPETVKGFLSGSSKWLLTTAMTAIGMKIALSSVLKEGRQALVAGGIVFLCQILFSMGLVLLI